MTKSQREAKCDYAMAIAQIYQALSALVCTELDLPDWKNWLPDMKHSIQVEFAEDFKKTLDSVVVGDRVTDLISQLETLIQVPWTIPILRDRMLVSRQILKSVLDTPLSESDRERLSRILVEKGTEFHNTHAGYIYPYLGYSATLAESYQVAESYVNTTVFDPDLETEALEHMLKAHMLQNGCDAQDTQHIWFWARNEMIMQQFQNYRLTRTSLGSTTPQDDSQD